MEHEHEHDTTIEDHDRGLAFDLPRLMSRRRAVGLLTGAVGSFALAACGSSADVAGTATSPAGESSTTDAAGGATAEIADETAGPFPGDGSNGPDVLTKTGVVRSDITTSFADASGTAAGVPTTVELTLLDVAAGGTPLAGAAVYIWHCDRDGRYSLYEDPVRNENFLRGVQASDKNGRVTFRTVFPGAYPGRWPHIHFEVHESVDAATAAGSKLKTSQLALPPKACEQAYAAKGYERSAQHLGELSLESDRVFGDGYAGQLATASGSVSGGLTLKLNVGV